MRIAAYEVGSEQEGRWVLARDLRAGDEVLLRDGEVVPLESVRLDEVEERVYNFHVEELQNYAVGGCGVLVHNTNDPAVPGRQKGKRMKLGDNALQQLDEIEKTQQDVRQGKSKQIIDSIEKSKQRAKNMLKRILRLEDLDALE
jgi:hypothetical protein